MCGCSTTTDALSEKLENALHRDADCPHPWGKHLNSAHFSWPQSSCRGLANSSHAGCLPPSRHRNRGLNARSATLCRMYQSWEHILCFPKSRPPALLYVGTEVESDLPSAGAHPRALGMSPTDTGSHLGQQHATSKVPTLLAVEQMPIFQVGV